MVRNLTSGYHNDIASISVSSNEKSIDFKNYLPTNTEIALSEIIFKNYSNNLKENATLEFNLTILEHKTGKTHLPTVKIDLRQSYFPDISHFIDLVQYHLDKKIHFFTSKDYYRHFLSRLTCYNDVFVILQNDSLYHYEMELIVDDHLKNFLNLSMNKILVTDNEFVNKKIVNFNYEMMFPIECAQLEKTSFLNKHLREVHTFLNYGHTKHIEFESLEWRRLQEFKFKSLILDWPDSYEVISYTINIREYF